MAKEFEDKFFEELRSGVVGSTPAKSPLEERRDALKAAIEELESNVIKDPKQLEKLKKELVSLEKEIKKEDAEKAVESGEVVGEGAAEKDKDEGVKEEEEKTAEAASEEPLIETEVDKEKEEKLRQAYYDAMIALHKKKMQTLEKQKTAYPFELVSSDSDYEQELELEAKLYEARDAYMKLGKEDTYTEKRTELIRLEKDAKEPIEMELRNRAKRFREIEVKLKELDEREQEINKELLSDDITEGQIKALQKELGEIGEQRKKLELERADIKDKLDSAIEIRRQRTAVRADLDKKHVATLTAEDKKNYDYQQSKIATMNHNFDAATKQHYENIKIRIEEREQKIKDINRELKEVPDTDFERRLVLLNELDKETSMLEADKEAKSDLDRSVVMGASKIKQEVYEKTDDEEYRQKQFDKATEEVREVIEEQDKKLGEAVVANPTVANVEERDRGTAAIAATYAVVHDSPAPGKDTIVQNVVQYEVAKCVIPGLEGQVKTIDDTEEGRKNAEEYLEQDEQIREADKALDRIEDSLTKQ